MATAAANESHSQLAEGAAVAAARTRSSGTAAEDERSATGGDAAAKDGVGQEAAAEEEKEVYGMEMEPLEAESGLTTRKTLMPPKLEQIKGMAGIFLLRRRYPRRAGSIPQNREP